MGVESVAEPVAGRFGDLATRDNEGVIDQDVTVGFGVKDLVCQHHECLVVDLSHVGITRLGYPRSVELALLRLYAEVENVLCRQGVAHPNVLAVLQGLVLVSGGGDAVVAKLPEHRE